MFSLRETLHRSVTGTNSDSDPPPPSESDDDDDGDDCDRADKPLAKAVAAGARPLSKLYFAADTSKLPALSKSEPVDNLSMNYFISIFVVLQTAAYLPSCALPFRQCLLHSIDLIFLPLFSFWESFLVGLGSITAANAPARDPSNMPIGAKSKASLPFLPPDEAALRETIFQVNWKISADSRNKCRESEYFS